jgi:hypothetical protein
VVHGVVHAAMEFYVENLARMDEAKFRSILEARTCSATVLRRVTESLPLDFLLFLSSGDSFTALVGHAAYVAACVFGDAYAAHLGALKPYPVKVINWGYWDPTEEQLTRFGQQGFQDRTAYVERLKRQGVTPISPERGAEAMARVLAGPFEQVVAMKVSDEILLSLGVNLGQRMERVEDRAPAMVEDLRSWIEHGEDALVRSSSLSGRVAPLGRA